MPQGVFPFGQQVKVLRQQDRSPKEVFVLGVYASAVHARWTDRFGKRMVTALAVASEPHIFWNGDNADKIVARIRVPSALGSLSPPPVQFNGPSGRSLDERFLQPMGLTRADVWLSDLYPYAMLNKNQLRAIGAKYSRLAARHGLQRSSLPTSPTSSPGARRAAEVLREIKESRASVLVLLGDRPIAWFLSLFHPEFRRLSQFGRSPAEYGRLHPIDLEGSSLRILPVVHPRQASRLGASSPSWGKAHDVWVSSVAPRLL
jgi:uracil-DNA glycosylase